MHRMIDRGIDVLELHDRWRGRWEIPAAKAWPPPNTLFTRDTTCWIYGGATLNPLYFPARHDETLLMKAIYRFHPRPRRFEDRVGRPRGRLGSGDPGGATSWFPATAWC